MSTVTAVPIAPVRRSHVVWLLVGIAIAVLGAAALAFAAPSAQSTPSGLRYQVIEAGQGGAHPTDSDVALVNYVGRLPDGTVFDKSQQPTPMPVAGVVPGFSEALKLMTKGAKYRVWIPSTLGYGEKATGPIPAGSTLDFDIELLEFLSEAQVRAMQQMQMQQQMGGGMPQGAAGQAPGQGAPGQGAPPQGMPGGR